MKPDIGLNPFQKAVLRYKGLKTELLPHSKRLFSQITGNTTVFITGLNWTAFELTLFNLICSRHGLPQITSDATEPRFLNDKNSHGQTTPRFIYLPMNASSHECQKETLKRLNSIISQSESLSDGMIVPVCILWNRVPSPNRMSAAMQLLRFGNLSLISTADPIYLKEFTKSGAGLTDPGLRLYRHILRSVYRESRIITGPPPESRISVQNKILASPSLKEHIERTASKSGKSLSDTIVRARTQIDEIAAEYCDRMTQVWWMILRRTMHRRVDRIEFDEAGSDRLRQILRQKKPCILIPTHRSHIDYVIVSYGVYLQGIVPPLVAAGNNLSFWPMGWMFRKSGAFFIRRTFKGLDLYPHVFKEYLFSLMRKARHMEFFVEGGRSRDGYLRPPKLGFLNMILDALNHDIIPEVYFVPISINYDRVMEADGYRDELFGRPKKKETFWQLIRNRHVLKRYYGGIYVSIGDPIVVRNEPGQKSHQSKEITGNLIMHALGSLMPVTPVSIISTILINHGSRPMDPLDLNRQFKLFVDFLSISGCIFSQELKNQSETLDTIVDNAIRFLLDNQLLTLTIDNLIHIAQDQRLLFDYTKNSLLNYLLPLAASAISLQMDGDGLANARKICSLFCPEFHPVSPNLMENTLVLTYKNLKDRHPDDLRLFSLSIEPVLRTMVELFRYSKENTIQFSQKKFVPLIQSLQDKMNLSEQFPEACIPTIYEKIRKVMLKSGVQDLHPQDSSDLALEKMAFWEKLLAFLT